MNLADMITTKVNRHTPFPHRADSALCVYLQMTAPKAVKLHCDTDYKEKGCFL